MARDLPRLPGDASTTDDVTRDEEPAVPSSPGATIAVAWSASRRAPVAFDWRGRRWRIERIVESWVVQTGWWSESARVDRAFVRVRAEGRVFDLCHDRVAEAWFLHAVVS